MQLSIEGVSKAFPGVQALDKVSFELRPGEIQALMGENGAGKSTLIKIITGLYRPDDGRVMIDGQEMSFQSPRDAIAAGIGAVHQERNLIPRFSVGENILLERLPTRNGLLDKDAIHNEARRYLDLLDRGIDTHTEVRSLSVAQMQIVEIAKALSLETKCLLMDEPTASITEHETEALFTLLKRLRDEGASIVFVSHKLEEVFAIADRVTVLRDGKNAALGEPMSTMTRQNLISLMVGREEHIVNKPQRSVDTGVVLEARGLQTSFGHRDISFSLKRGEILGLYGLVGAGRSELARAIVGAAPITGGEVLVNGKTADIRNVHQALNQFRIGYISEDRKNEGLILTHTIRENIAVTIWRRLAGALGLIRPSAELDAVMPYVERLEIRTPSVEQKVGNLSGGNQQKVSVAKWLAANVEILIIDEPTVGIDIKTKAYLHELIHEIAAGGTSVLLISSDMPEMVALADRILVMHDMRLVGEVANDRRYETVSNAIMNRIHAVEEERSTATAG
ncbi:MAG: sugar ABC transporter ATP-binding protein [Mesorhizobium sp.]|nr:sugar ABC transporter ATP-binding protein [Mesorhizobium sp.]MBL8579950.1 sugar ABC transporter ATP-binding protein [Mesorhizobium sp.]